MYYALLKHLLFRFDPETAHRLTLRALKIAHFYGLSALFPKIPAMPVTVFGLTFPNPIGLAAGLDKNGDYIEALSALGFGFVEIGTITPKPQIGNPTPRLFRLEDQQAIINRMGFNNKGVDYLADQLKKTDYQGILGINIGKNRDTGNDKAIDDYLYCFRRVYPYASYVTVNISSPNTTALRELQHGDLLRSLLHALKREQQLQFELQKRYVPLVVKIAPDLSTIELEAIADILLAEEIDGVIATNTTLSREGVEASPFSSEAGGLSGKPLFASSTAVVKQLSSLLQNKIPIIAAGGIMTPEDAVNKLKAGATLIQLYSGLIYEGPGLISDIARALITKNF
ncbi:MAG: quinone-dependent dihydroorotate dehydrogenase [Gammaproteobacteria bacterium]|nr:quinone-dependent dihydroorotate dehydrogenase [Gammaproteobacteria bacterium]